MRKILLIFAILLCTIMTVSAVNASDIAFDDSSVVLDDNQVSTSKIAYDDFIAEAEGADNDASIGEANTDNIIDNKDNDFKSKNIKEKILSYDHNESNWKTTVYSWDDLLAALESGDKESFFLANDIDVSEVTETLNYPYHIVINGDGHSIYGLNHNLGLINFTSQATLKNIVFKDNLNNNQEDENAMLNSYSDLEIINCTFENTKNAIKTISGNLSVSNSSFRNNVRSDMGASIIVSDSNIKVFNTEFKNNHAEQGAAIYFDVNSGNFEALINNCTFINNSAENKGGAIGVNNLNNVNYTLAVIDSKFENNENTTIFLDYGSSLYLINTDINPDEINYRSFGNIYNFTAPISDFSIATPANIEVTETNGYEGSVKILIGTKEIDIPFENGYGKVRQDLDLALGKYNVTLVLQGPDDSPKRFKIKEISVKPKEYNIEYSILNNITGNLAIEIEVYDGTGNEVIGNENVTLKLDGIELGTVKPFRVYKNTDLPEGEYTIIASYGTNETEININLTDPFKKIKELNDVIGNKTTELDTANENILNMTILMNEMYDNLTRTEAEANYFNDLNWNLTLQLRELSDNLTRAEAELNAANEKISNLTNQIDNLTEELKKTQTNLDNANKHLNELNAKISAIKDSLKNTIELTKDGNEVLIGLKDSKGSPISGAELNVLVNGVSTPVNTTDTKGESRVSVNGNATISVSYTDTNNVTVSNSLQIIINTEIVNNTVYVNLTPNRTSTSIKYSNMTIVSVPASDGRIGKYFEVVLLDAKGKTLANKNIQIGFNGKVYNRTTNETGGAKLQINLPQEGKYTFAIAFLGDDNYTGSFEVALITVTPQTPKLTASKKTFKASAKIKSISATFKTANGNAVKGKQIRFTANGKTYTAKTNSNGVATVKISLSKKGTYSTVAKFEGDSSFKATSTKFNIRIV